MNFRRWWTEVHDCMKILLKWNVKVAWKKVAGSLLTLVSTLLLRFRNIEFNYCQHRYRNLITSLLYFKLFSHCLKYLYCKSGKCFKFLYRWFLRNSSRILLSNNFCLNVIRNAQIFVIKPPESFFRFTVNRINWK